MGITGEDVIASDEMTLTQVDVKKATLIALAGVSLLFILAFRGIAKPLMAVYLPDRRPLLVDGLHKPSPSAI